jgi:hypothetical protein
VIATAPDPTDSNVSRLTYENVSTHNGECFGRIDSPYRIFVKALLVQASCKFGVPAPTGSKS